MKPIRVFIVDAAVVMRRVVGDVLAADPAIEVVGTAANGQIALEKLTQAAPDIVTLGIGTAEMDGLETLRQIRLTHPTLPVIVFSALTERDAAATLDALSLGASDYIITPACAGSVDLVRLRTREDLIPKIKALCASTLTSAITTTPPAVGPLAPAPPVDAIAIGVSTGGPRALFELIPALPADLQVPILIVQHMPPAFTRMLAERLQSRSSLPVVEASTDLEVKPGHVYLAPGDFHMTVRRQGTKVLTGLNHEPAEHSCRPAIDVLFRAVARVYGAGALGVALTGMGQDGLRGAEHIVRHGGRVLAQCDATSLASSMPGFVVRAGLADRVLPLPLIADEIVRRAAGVPPECARAR